MHSLESYMIADSKFFESPTLIKSNNDYNEDIIELMPKNWSLKPREFWFDAIPVNGAEAIELPPQGFKIHVSATISNAKDVIRAVVPCLIKAKIRFKIVRNSSLLSHINSKNFGRGGSGKFITAYPANEQFEFIIDRLANETAGLDGPYILSDKRYPGSKVVHYRYGGFTPVFELYPDGTRKFKITSPDNTLVDDDRKPFFKLPEWVKDPFPDTGVALQERGFLAGRYKIIGAIKFANSGGVYRAVDLNTKQEVVIKEARPNTNFWVSELGSVDASDLLAHEFKVLNQLKGSDYIVTPIDFFKAWEHSFLVLELIDGTILRRIRAHDDFSLIPFKGNASTAKKFTKKFVVLASNLIKAIKSVHEHHVVIGDLSPGNILIDKKTLRLKLVDFESAQFIGRKSASDVFSRAWSTIGMRPGEHIRNRDLKFDDDWYSAAICLQSLLIPTEGQFNLNPDSQEAFLEAVVRDAGVPEIVPNVIRSIKTGDHASAQQSLANYVWQPHASRRDAARFMVSGNWAERQAKIERVTLDSRRSVQGIVESMLKSATPSRLERLWPLDYSVFERNGLSIGLGCAGPFAFLSLQSVEIPKEMLTAWNAAIDRSINITPLGLYNGLAGIAYALALCGQESKADNVHALMVHKALAAGDPSFSDGVSGCAWASLAIYRITGRSHYIDAALKLTTHLMTLRQPRNAQGYTWKSEMHPELRGVSYGAAGISLLATQLAAAVPQNSQFRDLAVDAFLEDFEPSKDTLRWSSTAGPKIVSPYWSTGAAGMAAVACRVAVCTGESKFIEIADAILRKNASLYAVMPGQFEGLAGIGEAFLDIYALTKLERYRVSAFDIANSILLYEIRDEAGVWYPGRQLLRRSQDFSYGAAGIGAFLHRLIVGGTRLLNDI